MKYWKGASRLWVWTWCLGLGWVGAVGQTLPGAAEAPGAKRPVARVEDANGNGKVDKGERKAALESWQARRRQQQKAETEAKAAVRRADENVKRQQQKVSATLLEKYDRNKNGRMDPNEWERRRKDLDEIRKQRQPR